MKQVTVEGSANDVFLNKQLPERMSAKDSKYDWTVI
jgi:hypothetical protein